ncbi:MAG: hypothetical protein ACI4OT_03815 [Bacilli bacterium]
MIIIREINKKQIKVLNKNIIIITLLAYFVVLKIAIEVFEGVEPYILLNN